MIPSYTHTLKNAESSPFCGAKRVTAANTAKLKADAARVR
jgi:hypothetical protein